MSFSVRQKEWPPEPGSLCNLKWGVNAGHAAGSFHFVALSDRILRCQSLAVTTRVIAPSSNFDPQVCATGWSLLCETSVLTVDIRTLDPQGIYNGFMQMRAWVHAGLGALWTPSMSRIRWRLAPSTSAASAVTSGWIMQCLGIGWCFAPRGSSDCHGLAMNHCEYGGKQFVELNKEWLTWQGIAGPFQTKTIFKDRMHTNIETTCKHTHTETISGSSQPATKATFKKRMHTHTKVAI